MEVLAVRIEVAEVKQGEPEWAEDMVKHLNTRELPAKKKEVRKIKRRVAQFTKIDRVLYKPSFSTPLLRCMSPKEVEYVLVEILEGVCMNHSGGKTLVRKVVRAGYYWPCALRDAKEFVKKYVMCQVFAPITHCLLKELTSIMSHWPFP